jgi:hypothetical protein
MVFVSEADPKKIAAFIPYVIIKEGKEQELAQDSGLRE